MAWLLDNLTYGD